MVALPQLRELPFAVALVQDAAATADAAVAAGIEAAVSALRDGALVVLPTDTVYGVAANAFDAAAVQRLLDAKGRTRQSPPPVLIGDVEPPAATEDELLDDGADPGPDAVLEAAPETDQPD